MNERIRAIWETNDSITVVWPETGSPVRVSAALLEKFAELIVKECISKLDDIGVIDRDSRAIAMKVISEHFGVKE